MKLRFHPYSSAWVAHIRQGGADDYGQPAERAISDGAGNPCRSCLDDVSKGAEMLICAARPFPEKQPYAETGPIFLCADECSPWTGEGVPPALRSSPDYLLKGYSADHRIVYGTGQITLAADIERVAAEILARAEVTFVDVRSARNYCFQCRITAG
ncbi:MAG TPA: DUF1203 domain-containing protein [Rhodobacteraceae bacterium]|nr:DUF1203 domain-containing protein [Paracoccaceae bacterium]